MIGGLFGVRLGLTHVKETRRDRFLEVVPVVIVRSRKERPGPKMTEAMAQEQPGAMPLIS